MELLKSLLLAGSVQGFFLILLLSAKHKKSFADQVLMFWLVIIAIQLLFYYDNLSLKPLAPGSIQIIAFSLPLISSPVLFLYIKTLAFSRKLRRITILQNAIPFLLFNVTWIIAYLIYPDAMHIRKGIPVFAPTLPLWLSYSFSIPLAIVPGYYAVLSLGVLFKYQKSLPDIYSYTERINLNWLKWLVISLHILFISLFLLIRYGMNYGIVNKEDLFIIVGTTLSAYVFFVGYFGLRQTLIFPAVDEQKLPTEPPLSYRNSGLSETESSVLFDRLRQHMEKERPFLDENLSLPILAAQLECSSNQMSQVINQHTGGNFFNFINGYRVEMVKKSLKDPSFSHYSILAIGYDCGFQSKSSFNKIFKQITGLTPSEYQKS